MCHLGGTQSLACNAPIRSSRTDFLDMSRFATTAAGGREIWSLARSRCMSKSMAAETASWRGTSVTYSTNSPTYCHLLLIFAAVDLATLRVTTCCPTLVLQSPVNWMTFSDETAGSDESPGIAERTASNTSSFVAAVSMSTSSSSEETPS